MEVIFLDIDNTLLDFEAFSRTAMRRGFDEFQLGPWNEAHFATFQRINSALWRALEDKALDFETLQAIRWNLVFKALGISFDGQIFERYYRGELNESAIPIAGAEELLGCLAGRYILCAASNGPTGQQIHRLELAGMRHFFFQIFVSEEMGASKPDEAFFTRSLQRLTAALGRSVPADACCMIGDSLSSDIRGGLRAGMHTIWFDRRGEGLQGEIRPEYVVHHLSEIQSIL